MKWVKIREGHYRLVGDDDTRPAVKLPSKKIGNFFLGYSPGWAGTFKRLSPHPEAMDAVGEREATDVMLGEKEKELKVDKKAQKWERGRKVAWKKNIAFKKAKKRVHRQKVEKAKKIAIDFLKSRTREKKKKT